MKKLWHCPHCTQTSTRRWNLAVHIKRRHSGAGYPIAMDRSYFNSRFVPDINLENNNHSGRNPHLNPFSAQYQEKRDVLSTKKSDPFDEIREMIRKTVEWARPWVEFKNVLNDLSPPSSSISPDGISLSNTSYIEWLLLQSFTPSTDPLRDRIVSYKGMVCESCLASLSLPIYRFNDTGIEVESKHICNHKRLNGARHH